MTRKNIDGNNEANNRKEQIMNEQLTLKDLVGTATEEKEIAMTTLQQELNQVLETTVKETTMATTKNSKEIDGNSEAKKGEPAMSTSNATVNTSEQKVKTVWDYTREAIARGFIESGLKTEFNVKVKRYFDKQFVDFKTGEKKIFEGAENVFNFLTYLNGIDKIQFEDIKYVEEKVNEKTGEITPGYYIVKVKNFNPAVKTKSKRTGNMYNYFYKELGMLCQYNTKATA